jgi:hypothetical protein
MVKMARATTQRSPGVIMMAMATGGLKNHSMAKYTKMMSGAAVKKPWIT